MTGKRMSYTYKFPQLALFQKCSNDECNDDDRETEDEYDTYFFLYTDAAYVIIKSSVALTLCMCFCIHMAVCAL